MTGGLVQRGGAKPAASMPLDRFGSTIAAENSRNRGEPRMERAYQTPIAIKTCPACGSADYLFRGRKKIATEPGKNDGECVETKCRCKASGQEWRVRTQTPGLA